jgi:hypothetical protein
MAGKTPGAQGVKTLLPSAAPRWSPGLSLSFAVSNPFGSLKG